MHKMYKDLFTKKNVQGLEQELQSNNQFQDSPALEIILLFKIF